MALCDRLPLKTGSIHMTGQEKSPFNTGGCLTEVTTWTGLIVLTVSYTGT